MECKLPHPGFELGSLISFSATNDHYAKHAYKKRVIAVYLFTFVLTLSDGAEKYTDCTTAERSDRHTHPNECPGYDTKKQKNYAFLKFLIVSKNFAI